MVAGISLSPVSARAEAFVDEARRFIDELAERASTVLADKNVSASERTSRFRAMFTESFNVPEVARFVLGRYWGKATPEQREEYLQLFEKLIIGTWAPRFAEYNRESFNITSARVVGEESALVASTLTVGTSEPFRVDWRVGRLDQTYKILDIVVEGISMKVTHRSEFGSVIRRNGGLEGLLQALRKKTAALKLE